MFPTCIPFPSSGDKENIPVTRSERTRRNALIGTKRIITGGQSISVLTNPERTRAHSVAPTIHEKVPPSPLRATYRPPSLSPISILKNPARARPLTPIIKSSCSLPSVRQSRSPLHITILSNPEREKREAHPRSPSSARQSRPPSHITILSNPEKEKRDSHPISPSSVRQSSVRQSRSRSHITILSNPEREKREAHPQPPPSVSRSRPLSHVTILSNPEKEKRNAHLRSTQRTKSIRNALAAALALKRAPTISITPISILKAPTPPLSPAPGLPPAADRAVEVPSVQETGQGVRDPETVTVEDTTTTSSGQMLRVPLIDWRGRLDEDEVSRYYPTEHAKEQLMHGPRSMVRSRNRSAAARRRDHTRRHRQTTATAPAITTPSIALIVSPTRP